MNASLVGSKLAMSTKLVDRDLGRDQLILGTMHFGSNLLQLQWLACDNVQLEQCLLIDKDIVEVDANNFDNLVDLRELHKLGEKGHDADVLNVWIGKVFRLQLDRWLDAHQLGTVQR